MRIRLSFAALLAAFIVVPAAAQREPRLTPPVTPAGAAFIHTTRTGSGDNTAFNFTWIVSEYPGFDTSPVTDNNPDAVVFFTHNLSDSLVSHTAASGVYFDTTWRIFNEDQVTAFANGEAFNIQVAGRSDSVFVHTATLETLAAAATYLDHPLLNGNPDALLSVTPRWEGVYNNNFIGVYYSGTESRWSIFNQSQTAIPLNAMFNVQVLLDPDTDFSHLATVGNIVSTSRTRLDHPLLNNNPNAQLIVTQNYSLGTAYNEHPVGVEYDAVSDRWRIMNTDGAAMPVGAGFNVHISNLGDVYGDGMLYNGSFESPGANKKQAITWAGSAGTKRVCDKYAPKSPATKIVSLAGECAFLLQGAAGDPIRTLTQTASVASGLPGNTVDLTGWAKGKNAAGAKAKVVITLNDTNKVKFKVPGSFLNGTHDWDIFGNQLMLPPGTDPVTIKVRISLGSGKLYVDELSSVYFTITR